MNPLLRKLTNIWGRGAVTLEIPPSVQMTWPELIREVVAQAPLSDSPIHGEKHWMSVAKTAFLISDLTGYADKASLLGFALFHDSRRFYDQADPDHGLRAGVYAEQHEGLLQVMGHDKRNDIAEACSSHNWPDTSQDTFTGICLDADRINLIRLGRRINPSYMSILREEDMRAMISLTEKHMNKPPSWDDLIREVMNEEQQG